MFELMLIVFLLIGGLLGGGVLAFASGISELFIPFVVIGGLLGVAFAYWILLVWKRRIIRNAAFVPSLMNQFDDALKQPVDFKLRLMQYFRYSESDPKSDSTPFRSSMPMWTIVTEYWRTPSRSAEQLRAILIRIRERLRGAK
jgi:hypothetical protein